MKTRLLVADVPKFRRCSSEEAASIQPSLAVAVPETALYGDGTSDVSARQGVGMSVTSQLLFPCLSVGSGDASVTRTRVIDDNSVIGGVY